MAMNSRRKGEREVEVVREGVWGKALVATESSSGGRGCIGGAQGVYRGCIGDEQGV
jgi:hypothetical protein